MATRIVFVIVAALVIFQMVTWGTASPRVAREAPEKNISQTIEETLQNFQSEMQNLLKNIRENELFQNISQQLQTFGNAVQAEGKQLVDKIQSSADQNKN